MTHHVRIVATAAAMAFAFGACTSEEGADARVDAPPITLRLGTPYPRDAASGDAAAFFAASVARGTNGAVQVSIVWDAGNEVSPLAHPAWDHTVITQLSKGRIDLALVPAGAFDEVSEPAFRVLQAPFLIQSDAAAEGVARSDAALAMLARLSTSGLLGMALIPEGPRHIASFGQPLLTPGDFRGVRTRARLSDSVFETLTAIGLLPTAATAQEFAEGVSTGDIGAADVSFAEFQALPSAVVYTGNVTPYTQFDVLAARAASLLKLSPEQRAVLQTAAHDTLDLAIANRHGDAAAADEYCRRGGAIVLAPPSTLQALQLASRPVLDQLERDPSTGPALIAVRRIVMASPVSAPVTGCVPASPGAPMTYDTTPTVSEPVTRNRAWH
ncbi:TRAP transporter substrate-binding protein DctP [Monashia sp. NPDC004114]